MTINLFPHDKWLLCEPLFFDVTYEINPWMSVARPPVRTRAEMQWRTLHHTILRLGGWIEYVQPIHGLPDMVFTANAGLIRGTTCVLSKFRHKERQGEERHFQEWFERDGFKVVHVTHSFEGEGDALFAGEKLFGGYGFRTERAALEEAATALEVGSLIACELVDPRFYHIDTCFCPLSPHKAIFVPSAFSRESICLMEREIELIPIPDSDAIRFACNAIILGNAIVIPDGCRGTEEILQREGITPYPVALDEFIKAGGAAKCLVIKLTR